MCLAFGFLVFGMLLINPITFVSSYPPEIQEQYYRLHGCFILLELEVSYKGFYFPIFTYFFCLLGIPFLWTGYCLQT